VNLSFSPSLYLNNLDNDDNVSFESHKIELDVKIDNNPKLFYHSSLNDLIRNLDLSKENSELLGSRLKERNL